MRALWGWDEELQRRLPRVSSDDELRALSDDRYLSAMCLRIFGAGLRHSMVDARWLWLKRALFVTGEESVPFAATPR